MEDFGGDTGKETFVAFLDISGFKDKMKDGKKAWEALDKFYQLGYDVLGEREHKQVKGLFISDKGVLFARNGRNITECLVPLLKVIKKINTCMLKHNIMLTASIAYGHFKHQKRIMLEYIVKHPIYGAAYVSAFLDNKNGNPKIQPGQCRIVDNEKLPKELKEMFVRNSQQNEILRMIRKRNNDRKHYYFYWMRESPNEICDFEKQYKDACKLKHDLKYDAMLKALKGESE